MLLLEHSFVWCRKFGNFPNKSEMSVKDLKIALQNDGEDRLDRSCEE
jgi:hypothetical protein